MSELTVLPVRKISSRLEEDSCSYDRIGQRLVELVKLDNSVSYNKEKDILDLLFQLEILIRRCGLYFGRTSNNTEENVVDTTSSTTNDVDFLISVKGGRGSNKRQKKLLAVSTNNNRGDVTKNSTITTTDEELILLGITRILVNNHHTLTHVSIEAAAQVILALTNNSSITTAATVVVSATPTNPLEQQIAKYSSQWLSSLWNHLESLLQQVDNIGSYFGVLPTSNVLENRTNPEKNTTAAATDASSLISCTISCLQASTSIISFLGIPRTSKVVNRTIINKLNSIAWRIMGCHCWMEENTIIQSAAMLIATLPSTNLPWTDAFVMALSSVASVIYRAYPGSTILSLDWIDQQHQQLRKQQLQDCFYDNNHHQWLQTLPHHLPFQEERTKAVYQRINALCHLLLSYMNEYDTYRIVLAVTFPVTYVLDTCELLLTFGAGAENRYHKMIHSSNNKRSTANLTAMNIVPDENALLSISSVIQIMNDIRYWGHSLLITTLSTVGSTLLPHAKRISTLIEISLLSSCSADIQNLILVVTNATAGNNNRNNNSIALRSKAIQTAQVAMLTLGSGATLSFWKTSQLIAGCLLETLLIDDNILSNHSSWGSSSERAVLIMEGLEALSTFFSVSGHLLPLPSRSKLEGVVRSVVDSIIAKKNTSSEIKVALLQLGISISSTPWIDGGISNLLPAFVNLGKLYKYDRDYTVVRMAYLIVNVCNSISTPRSVPLMNGTVNHRTVDTTAFSLDLGKQLSNDIQMRAENKRTKEQIPNNLDASTTSLFQHEQVCNAHTLGTEEINTKTDETTGSESLPYDLSNTLANQEKCAGSDANNMKQALSNAINDDFHDGSLETLVQLPRSAPNEVIFEQTLEHDGIVSKAEGINFNVHQEGRIPEPPSVSSKQKNDDDDDDDDFPEIVDCDPDEE